MKSSFILLSTIALFSLSLASVVTPGGGKKAVYPQPSDNCEVPSLVSYCLDMMKLGSLYDKEDAGNPTLAKLKADVAEIPMGACSWVEFSGKASVQDCMQALEDYIAKDEEEETKPGKKPGKGTEIATTDRGFFKKIKKAIKKGVKKVGNAVKKGVKKIGKGLKKAGKGVEKGVKKVAKFCKENKKVCQKAAQIGFKIIQGESILGVVSSDK